MPGAQKFGALTVLAGGALAGVGAGVALIGAATQGAARGGARGAAANVASDFWQAGFFKIASSAGPFFQGAATAAETALAIIDPRQLNPNESFETCSG